MNGKEKKRLLTLLPVLAACVLAACATGGDEDGSSGGTVLPGASGESHFAAYLRYRALEDGGMDCARPAPDCSGR